MNTSGVNFVFNVIAEVPARRQVPPGQPPPPLPPPFRYATGAKKTGTMHCVAHCKIGCCTVTPYTFEAKITRRPASADMTARRQFQVTGQPVSRTQASDAMTSRLPRYEAKCVQRRCFQCGSFHLRSDIQGTELPPANILIPIERQLIALQLCR